MLSRRSFLSACTAATLAPSLLRAQPGGKKPNILLFLIDDLGWADLSCYGSRYHETPHLDRLASASLKFTHAYAACPVCSPTRESILTGLHPARTHLTNFLVGNRWPADSPLEPLTDWRKSIDRNHTTLPELLQAAGYTTTHMGKWHLGADEKPQDHGFDINIAGGRWGTPPSYFSPYKNPFLSDGPEGEYLTDRLGLEAEKFLESHAKNSPDKPFYLQLWHYGVHIPLRAPANLIKKYDAKAKPDNAVTNPTYAAMLESVDTTIGRILKKLDDLKLSDNTLVIFTSDNGGVSVREGGSIPTSNAPLRAGKGHLYEGGIRVPLLIRHPTLTKPNSTTDHPVISTDFLPTLTELAGIAPPKNLDGISFAPVLKDNTPPQRDALFWHYPHYANQGSVPSAAIRKGPWKLIEFFDTGKTELYNLDKDPSETTDLAQADPQQNAQLKQMLHAWQSRVGAQFPKRK